MAQQKPVFLITIDTEGDNLWSGPNPITTKNAQFLPRFQNLCEKYNLKPTYLTNYEMALDPNYQDFARDVIARKQGEIGTHLHAWNSPPTDHALTKNDFKNCPYLIEYPSTVIKDKFDYLHNLLEDTFQTKMTSHRAGRWAFNEEYAKILDQYKYTVDCSVTPYVNWENTPGDPKQFGGTNYSEFPNHAYFLDLENISQPGDSNLLELPMTIQPKLGYHFLPKSLIKYRNRLTSWLRPRGKKKNLSLKTFKQALSQNKPYLEFMIHSSEFMPGGSPYFPTTESVEHLFDELENLFELASNKCIGMTLNEYRQTFNNNHNGTK